jgi:hypothetical protein
MNATLRSGVLLPLAGGVGADLMVGGRGGLNPSSEAPAKGVTNA